MAQLHCAFSTMTRQELVGLWFKRSNRRVVSAKATYDDKTIEDIGTFFLTVILFVERRLGAARREEKHKIKGEAVKDKLDSHRSVEGDAFL
jgi:hypothetical protein